MTKLINFLMKHAKDKSEEILININQFDIVDDIDDAEELCYTLLNLAITIADGASFIIIKPIYKVSSNGDNLIVAKLSSEFIEFTNGEL